jgi:hypothetical protein
MMVSRNCSNFKVWGENKQGRPGCDYFDTSPAKIVNAAAHQIRARQINHLSSWAFPPWPATPGKAANGYRLH